MGNRIADEQGEHDPILYHHVLTNLRSKNMNKVHVDDISRPFQFWFKRSCRPSQSIHVSEGNHAEIERDDQYQIGANVVLMQAVGKHTLCLNRNRRE